MKLYNKKKFLTCTNCKHACIHICTHAFVFLPDNTQIRIKNASFKFKPIDNVFCRLLFSSHLCYLFKLIMPTLIIINKLSVQSNTLKSNLVYINSESSFHACEHTSSHFAKQKRQLYFDISKKTIIVNQA